MRRELRSIGLAALLAASVSCGDVVRDGRSPVLLLVSSVSDTQGKTPINSDVLTLVNDPAQATIEAVMKNTTVSPTSNNLVTISRYHVQFTRADGRNTEGIDVPYSFDGAVTATVAPGGSATLAFDLVRHAAKHEPPLTQVASGGTVLSTLTTITFYGEDTVGNSVSASGTIAVNFGRFGGS